MRQWLVCRCTGGQRDAWTCPAWAAMPGPISSSTTTAPASQPCSCTCRTGTTSTPSPTPWLRQATAPPRTLLYLHNLRQATWVPAAAWLAVEVGMAACLGEGWWCRGYRGCHTVGDAAQRWGGAGPGPSVNPLTRLWGEWDAYGVNEMPMGWVRCLWGEWDAYGVSVMPKGWVRCLWGEWDAYRVCEMPVEWVRCLWSEWAAYGVNEMPKGWVWCLQGEWDAYGVSVMPKGWVRCLWGEWDECRVDEMPMEWVRCLWSEWDTYGVREMPLEWVRCLWGECDAYGVSEMPWGEWDAYGVSEMSTEWVRRLWSEWETALCSFTSLIPPAQPHLFSVVIIWTVYKYVYVVVIVIYPTRWFSKQCIYVCSDRCFFHLLTLRAVYVRVVMLFVPYDDS